MRWLWLALVALASTSTAAPRTTQRSAEERSRAIARCQAAFGKLPDTDPAAKAAMVSVGCSELYVEKRCREAWTNFDVPPSKRLGFIVGECRAAYCPLLAPKPLLCTADLAALDVGDRLRLWSALQTAIFERDLGADEVRALGQVLAKLNLPLGAAVPKVPADGPVRLELPAVVVDLVVRVTKKSVSLYSRSGTDGTEAKPLMILRALPRKPGGPDFNYPALKDALHELVARRWPDPQKRPEASRELTLLVDQEVSFTVVKELLDAAREAFPNVVFAVSPEVRP